MLSGRMVKVHFLIYEEISEAEKKSTDAGYRGPNSAGITIVCVFY